MKTILIFILILKFGYSAYYDFQTIKLTLPINPKRETILSFYNYLRGELQTIEDHSIPKEIQMSLISLAYDHVGDSLYSSQTIQLVKLQRFKLNHFTMAQKSSPMNVSLDKIYDFYKTDNKSLKYVIQYFNFRAAKINIKNMLYRADIDNLTNVIISFESKLLFMINDKIERFNIPYHFKVLIIFEKEDLEKNLPLSSLKKTELSELLGQPLKIVANEIVGFKQQDVLNLEKELTLKETLSKDENGTSTTRDAEVFVSRVAESNKNRTKINKTEEQKKATVVEDSPEQPLINNKLKRKLKDTEVSESGKKKSKQDNSVEQSELDTLVKETIEKDSKLYKVNDVMVTHTSSSKLSEDDIDNFNIQMSKLDSKLLPAIKTKGWEILKDKLRSELGRKLEPGSVKFSFELRRGAYYTGEISFDKSGEQLEKYRIEYKHMGFPKIERTIDGLIIHLLFSFIPYKITKDSEYIMNYKMYEFIGEYLDKRTRLIYKVEKDLIDLRNELGAENTVDLRRSFLEEIKALSIHLNNLKTLLDI